MHASKHVNVTIDLARVRAAAESVRERTSVDVIAVLKADAYGLGALQVAGAVASAVDGFYVFDLNEAVAAGLARFGKPVIALLDETSDPQQYIDAGVRPVAWSVERAAALRKARPVMSVDTGQQRFACDPREVEAIVRAGEIDEAMTHASRVEQAIEFDKLTRPFKLRRHAAGSGLLDEPSARFDAVRPGLALYRNAVTVTTKLADARDSSGPAGYGQFRVARHGVILAGYSHGLMPGFCVINGQRRRIIEVGMQTAFVEIGKDDQAGDEVTLLGEALAVEDVARAWNVTPQHALFRLAGVGVRSYSSAGNPGEAR